MTGTLDAESVPYPFDVVIDGHGYRFLDSLQSHPFGTHRASYGLSPTFVPRTNIQGDYGDSFQDFWMTFTQRDWSLGEGQRHFKSGDDESVRSFWQGSKIDVTVPGAITMRPELRSATAAAGVLSACLRDKTTSQKVAYVTSANLYEITPEGSITDKGAHGVSPNVGPGAMTTDGTDIYIGHGSGIRKWDGTAYSAFSAQAATRLAFLNNSLYGLNGATMTLYVYDTAGVATSLHQWKQADGGARAVPIFYGMRPFGGDLLILLGEMGGEVYLYDGTGVALLFQLPEDFVGKNLAVVNGIIFIGGHFLRPKSTGSNYDAQSGVYFWSNGVPGILWRSETWGGTLTGAGDGWGTPVTSYLGGVVWADNYDQQLYFYDLTAGAQHRIASTSALGVEHLVASSSTLFMANGEVTAIRLFPDGTNLAAVSYVITSLFDGDNSLTKRFKSIIVDGELNGGTVDIAYQVDSLDGAFTTLQTGATMGTEYALPTVVTGRSICVKVTLNRASATAGPTLRRIKVRAAPMLDSFKRREYILDLSGRDGKSHILLRDDTQHSKDGLEMATDLNTAASSTVPITIVDRFSTFTGVVDTDGFTLVETRPEEFVAMVRVREV